MLRKHGGPEVLTVEDLPEPHAGPGEVRVRVAAVAVNHLDIWVRNGLPHLKLEYPFRLGADVAGTVDEVGPGVRGVAAGDEIVVNPGQSCGRCRECLSGRDNLCRWFRLMGEDISGGYCEQIVVPAQNVVPKPKSLSFTDAAALPTTFLTAWQMLTRKAPVRPGDDVLVMAAGSGVGVAAVQIARLHGARVIATASTDDKLARARALGADETINHASQDLVAEVKRLTGKRGVDIIFEHVGAEVWPKLILSVARGGRIVT
ncbi:MAG TPA: alcohol dehydrogenase catalytic domain-containing protein, partial [Polyangia bacterium]